MQPPRVRDLALLSRFRRPRHPEKSKSSLCSMEKGTELGGLTLQPAQHRRKSLPAEDQKSLVERSEREAMTCHIPSGGPAVWSMSVEETSSMNLIASTETAQHCLQILKQGPVSSRGSHPLEHRSDHTSEPKGGFRVISQHESHAIHETSSVLCTSSEARQARNVHSEPGWTRKHAKVCSRAQATHMQGLRNLHI